MSIAKQLQEKKLQDLKGQLNYANNCLINRFYEMEKWEIKEYTVLKEKLEVQVRSLEIHLIDCK